MILDDFQLTSVFQKFYTSAFAAILLIPVELYLQLKKRRSLVQYSFILLIVAIVLDTVVSTIAFYAPGNQFFAHLATSIGLERYSLLLLANEVLASVIAILGGIVVCVACQRLPFALNLIDHRYDRPSNRSR